MNAATIAIWVNGQARAVPPGVSVAELIAHIGLAGARVAVERNRVIVPRAEHATTRVEAGDRFELVTFVGGG